jgi:hypothetical protein
VGNSNGAGVGGGGEGEPDPSDLLDVAPQSMRTLGRHRHTRPSRFALSGRTGEEVNRYALVCMCAHVCFAGKDPPALTTCQVCTERGCVHECVVHLYVAWVKPRLFNARDGGKGEEVSWCYEGGVCCMHVCTLSIRACMRTSSCVRAPFCV